MRANMMRIRISLITLIVFAGCGDDGGEGVEPDASRLVDADTSSCSLIGSGTDDVSLTGSCSQETLIGTLLLAVDKVSYIEGKFADAVLPTNVRTEEMSMGSCRLMRKNVPFCDPLCPGDQACNLDGECVPYPVPQDLGEICLAGLEMPHVLTAQGQDKQYFNTQLSHPALLGGERIEVRSTGGAYQPIALAGVGVTPMLPGESLWKINGDDDLQVSWLTTDANAFSTIRLSLNVDQHGSSPLRLDCDFPDTGSAVVPGALIAALQSSGISGFPSGVLQRSTTDSVTVSDGCIEFVVRSQKTVDVRVANHTPCNAPGTCPDGLTCNLATETCE